MDEQQENYIFLTQPLATLKPSDTKFYVNNIASNIFSFSFGEVYVNEEII